MPIDKKVRKQVTDLVSNTLKLLDKSGRNSEYYTQFFNSMSDEEFKKWMKKFAEDDRQYIILQIKAFDKSKEPSLDDIEKAAKYLGIELDEYVYLPFLNPGKSPTKTQYKVPVGYLHMKRMQQMLSKKNVFSIDTNQRNMKTNQVTGESKAGRISDVETMSLLANNCENALKELLGPRADDSAMKESMIKNINRDGYVSLNDLKSDTKDKQTLNTVDVYMLGCGLKSDLITPTNLFRKTIDDKVTKELSGERYKQTV